MGEDYFVKIYSKTEIVISTAGNEYVIFLPVEVTVDSKESGEIKRGVDLTITKINGKINIQNP